jgi:putative ABC transport system substrate-binding protein
VATSASRIQSESLQREARRTLIRAAAAWPLCAWTAGVFAQAKKPPIVIGWLAAGRRENARGLAALKEGLAALGWKEGAQFVIEERWAEGEIERLPALAEELAARKPAVIVVASVTAAMRLAKVAPTTPIVLGGGTSPVEAGLAASLARPGGMVTGIANLAVELSEKLIELLVEVAPKIKRVGVMMYYGQTAQWRDATRRSAARYSVEAYFAYASKAEEIEPAIADLVKQKAAALIAIQHPFLNAHRTRIIQAHRWPVVAGQRQWVERGALLSYGIDPIFGYRRAAYYVDRILKGAKPGDLPIEQPIAFELAINMKTAKAFELTIPPTIRVRATHVIE